MIAQTSLVLTIALSPVNHIKQIAKISIVVIIELQSVPIVDALAAVHKPSPILLLNVLSTELLPLLLHQPDLIQPQRLGVSRLR